MTETAVSLSHERPPRYAGGTPTSAASRDVTPRVSDRWRTWRWVLLILVAAFAVSALTVFLTSPRPGGRMDTGSTGPEGAHALVALLRDHGVDVIVAENIDEVERNARPDTLLLFAESYLLTDEQLMQRLAAVPGDRLLVEPVSTTREVLADKIRNARSATVGGEPDCDLPEATKAGTAYFEFSETFEAADDVPVVRCYEGALVRYRDGERTVTVVGSADFMTNSGLLKEGNAALAMNLAGQHARLIWYVPKRIEGERSGGSDLVDLLPEHVGWIVLQLVFVVLLAAFWQGRRLGPLVAERLPVVVRASETVEGRGRLYRSRRARDRAADALRAAALHRMLPRLGLAVNASIPAVVSAVAARCRQQPEAVQHALYGPSPVTDSDLVNLARELDDIERQVAAS